MRFITLQSLADTLAAGHDIRGQILSILETEDRPQWQLNLRKLLRFLDSGIPEFSIVKNATETKLGTSFIAFSTLPGRGHCPGAGQCLEFCYSFKSWRYPAAFCRQLQNTVLMRSHAGRQLILASLDNFQCKRIDFRLYVDGDFSSLADLEFWLSAIERRPWLKTYGYSKSFREFLAYRGTWPENYVLNLSSGHKHSARTVEKIRQLPITRGEFVAVPMGKKIKSADHGKRSHQKTLRQIFGRKAFTCPGKCHSCTRSGHACGSMRFQNIPIIIGVH